MKFGSAVTNLIVFFRSKVTYYLLNCKFLAQKYPDYEMQESLQDGLHISYTPRDNQAIMNFEGDATEISMVATQMIKERYLRNRPMFNNVFKTNATNHFFETSRAGVPFPILV